MLLLSLVLPSADVRQQSTVQRDFPATVWEIVLSGCLARRGKRPFFSAAEKKRAHASLERLGIADLCRQSYRALSGGQQQRVLLARALCAADQLFCLDEPATGLDPKATASLDQALAFPLRAGHGHRHGIALTWTVRFAMQSIFFIWIRIPCFMAQPTHTGRRRFAIVFWEGLPMFEVLSTLFSYSFMMRALLAGALVALCAALLRASAWYSSGIL